MTIESARPDLVGVRPAGSRPAPEARQPMCIVVGELAAGDVESLVRGLHRRGLPRVVVLARRVHDAEILSLLAGGVRGVVVGQTDGMPEQATSAQDEVRARPDLSEREIEVLRRVADGRSNREIGTELGLSALTVKSHLARISRKLGTGDRAQLVAISIRADLLD